MSPLADAIGQYQAGRFSEAKLVCLRALRSDPDNSKCEHLLGLIAIRENQFAEAAEHFLRACRLKPGESEFSFDLAAAMGQLGDHAGAAQVLQSCLKLNPGSARGHNNLGVALERLGQFAGAEKSYRQSIRLVPNSHLTYLNLGNTLKKMHRLDEAIVEYRRVVKLQPLYKPGWLALAQAYVERASLEPTTETHRTICSLPDSTARDHSNLLYTLYYRPQSSPEFLLRESKAWGSRVCTHLPTLQPHQNDRSPQRRLRIGYLSPDFRDHPIGRLVEPVVADHNRDQFEVFCYSNLLPPGDTITEQIKKSAVTWRDTVSLSDHELADLIREDRIDILVETAGHFGGNRLPALALRPAPVQINAFGWCGTTGLSGVDYRLTDDYSDPQGKTDVHYTERLLRLPSCAWVYRPCDGAPDIGPLPVRANGFITFANLNNPIKTTPAMAALWCDILEAVPGAKLMLLVGRGTEELTLRRFAKFGASAERLILERPRPRMGYLDLFNRVDIVLDPFPFAGDNSTCDALWMGVPVVSMMGNAYHSRRGLGHLTNVGLPELAATHPAQYSALAIDLAKDTPRLASIRETLRDRLRKSPLGDVPRYVANLEKCYRDVWQNWCMENV